jgi:hypothetical protein|nr:MAG TPA: ERF superfamily protein [Caudoviricetes sp.]
MAEIAKKMNIYEAISRCMEEIGAVGKDAVNKQQGFKYRGIDAVMNAINPALTKNHVFIVPEVLDQSREERTTKSGGALIYSVCRIKYTFYAEDGSCIEAVTVGEGMDSGDKATNKAMAIAFKYACFQVFCIPTEEMKDPDEETQDPAKPQFNPATPEQLRKLNEFIMAYAGMCKNTKESDVTDMLKKKYQYNGTSDISTELADKLIQQVEFWYRKKKEADA